MSEDALRAAAEAVIEAWGAADQAYEMVGAIGALNDALASSRPEPLDDGHDHTPDCQCLPIRVVVDQHGHYWRDYGDHWSMCPVSTENVATEPVTEFYRYGEGGDFEDSAALASPRPKPLDVERPGDDCSGWRMGECGCTCHQDREYDRLGDKG